ncbi:hypothetical protein KsCSTR_28250 [Candidatus Kuenenia stuttgartiensis]|uniref:Uncharacterized protein n=1 Tax=Kuenenia stuttgartiensis TaxID=174633 RepID=A0A6G7GS71_KUEST|nr:hypothetical protein KsCSTR_28250 [Candidatus Kuenenia stuttgartiensis]
MSYEEVARLTNNQELRRIIQKQKLFQRKRKWKKQMGKKGIYRKNECK